MLVIHVSSAVAYTIERCSVSAVDRATVGCFLAPTRQDLSRERNKIQMLNDKQKDNMPDQNQRISTNQVKCLEGDEVQMIGYLSHNVPLN